MDKTLYLFPDTNLFIQCRALETLDWSGWSEFSEVHLVISRPVQREVDNQKNRGNDRVGRRARKAYQLFRRVIESDQDHILVREADPRVKLLLAGPGNPAPELSGTLDYSQNDDAIVGHLHEYRKQHRERDARLLTQDSGPMMTASALDLPFVPIPSTWLLDPERTEEEKAIQRLTDRVRRLEAGPSFQVEFVDRNGKPVQEIRAAHRVYAPLSETELAELVQQLRGRFRLHAMYGTRFHEWLDACERVLATLHDELQVESGGVSFTIMAANNGTRPAKDALVQIATRGNLSVRPHRDEAVEFYAVIQRTRMSLPSPPRPFDGFNTGALLGSVADSTRRRDPNALYYKPERPKSPVASYALECEQWRHGVAAKRFDGEIFVEHGSEEARGALECTIHADNLSEPVRTIVPVRIDVRSTSASVLERARELVESLDPEL